MRAHSGCSAILRKRGQRRIAGGPEENSGKYVSCFRGDSAVVVHLPEDRVDVARGRRHHRPGRLGGAHQFV